MKTKTAKKVIVAAMATAMGAGIVGSISGTVAWYQYSTRSTVAYQGAAAHCSENLQIRIRSSNSTIGAWKSDLTSTDIANYLSAANTDTAGGAGRTVAGNTLRPVTSGKLELGEVADTLYKNPIYQYESQTSWGTASATMDYIEIPLELRVLDVTGATSDSFLAKKIYVTNVTIQAANDSESTLYDLSDAIRVGVSAGTTPTSGNSLVLTDYATFGTANAAAAAGIAVSGNLDLNKDGIIDTTNNYDFDATKTAAVYGDAGKFAKATAITQLGPDAAATVVGVANDSNPLAIKGKEIGATTADQTLSVNLKIYLEGWAPINTNNKAKATATSESAETPIQSIWDIAKANGAKFNVGVRFSAEAHADTDHNA